MYVRKKRRMVAEINVVPYIDVMLVLLIIFMVTTPIITQGVKVELPKSDAEPIEQMKDGKTPLVATVDSHVPWEVYCILIHVTVSALLHTFDQVRDNSSRADLPKVCEILRMPHQRLNLMLSHCIWSRLSSRLVDWQHTCCCRRHADRSPPSSSII